MNRQDLQNLAEAYAQISEKKKDDSYLETDMKKRQENNEKARKEMEKVPGQKNPHFEQYTVTNADKKANTKAYQNFKAGMKKKDGTPMYKAADHMKEGVRDVDPEKGTAERKARLEKKRGMKLDDHPQYQKEGYGASAQQAGFQRIKDKESGGPGVGKVRSDDEIKKEKGGQAFLDRIAKAKAKMNKEEVEQVDEADSLAAMQARREKRLAAQRKREGTTATGQDFGHDYGISSAERKKRQQAEFDAFIGRGKKTKKESYDAMAKEYVTEILGAFANPLGTLATPVGAGLAGGAVGAVTGGKKKVKKSLATGAGAAAGAALGGGLPGAIIGGLAGNALS